MLQNDPTQRCQRSLRNTFLSWIKFPNNFHLSARFLIVCDDIALDPQVGRIQGRCSLTSSEREWKRKNASISKYGHDYASYFQHHKYSNAHKVEQVRQARHEKHVWKLSLKTSKNKPPFKAPAEGPTLGIDNMFVVRWRTLVVSRGKLKIISRQRVRWWRKQNPFTLSKDDVLILLCTQII